MRKLMKKYVLTVILGIVLLGGVAALMPRPQAAGSPPESAPPTLADTPQTQAPEDPADSAPEPDPDKPLLVNADYPTGDSTEGFVRVFDYMTDSYFVSGTDVLVAPEVMQPLNDMMDAFYNETGLKTVNVISGYRSYALQRELFEEKAAETGEEEAARWVSRPGYSEHHTGLAIDLGLFYEADGSSGEFDGTGDYAWFAAHAAEYGFILRYPEDKSDITGIAYEPWHFRYVGVEHAQAITEAGLTLEEYVLR